MADYRPRFGDPSRPEDSPTVVRTPAGDELDVLDPALATELGHGARPIKQSRGVFDAMPLSVIATGSVAALAERAGTAADARRYRPNVLVEAAAFAEDEWVGRVLRVGGMRMRVDLRDPRCVVVNVDPATSTRDPAVLRAIAQERDSCLGVYGSTVDPGRVAVGDAVVLE
jgi:uncharacterized protein YcbX